MINFYKQDGIGKAAFADGSIYTPQGNVSLLLDATTKQIIIAEDEKVLFYVNLSEELQVDGSAITGTDAEKLAAIAPIFQNATGGNTGGGGGRFAVEDNTSNVDRAIDMLNHALSIIKLRYVDLKAGDDSTFGLVNANLFGAKMQNSRQGEGDVSFAVNGADKEMSVQITNFTPSGPKALANNGFYLQPTWTDSFNDGEPFLARFTGTMNDGQSEECDIRIPIAAPGIHYLPLIPTQQFANNADAVAALGVGKLYISSSFSTNGSPHILITV